jgi:hypothetical protein
MNAARPIATVYPSRSRDFHAVEKVESKSVQVLGREAVDPKEEGGSPQGSPEEVRYDAHQGGRLEIGGSQEGQESHASQSSDRVAREAGHC